MKVVNKEMSTFIIALGRILKDLVYFAIVLLVVILMFGDVSPVCTCYRELFLKIISRFKLINVLVGHIQLPFPTLIDVSDRDVSAMFDQVRCI
jgi:hypothetical protein